MGMHWIVQNNVFNEERYKDVIQTLERGGIPFTEVLVVPFSHELIPEPEVQNPIAVIGSYGLVKVASARGWGPGVFYNDQIDYEVYAAVFGEDLLNAGAQVLSLGEVRLSEPSFLRPTGDGKDFAGIVMVPEEFADWQKRIYEIDDYATVTPDTRVVVAPWKQIFSEYRFFVVDQNIVAASRYKLGGRLNQSADVPPEVWSAAVGFVERWQPDRAFVIDVALTPEGPKVIEFNNINAAGWYHADVSRIIQAIDQMLA